MRSGGEFMVIRKGLTTTTASIGAAEGLLDQARVGQAVVTGAHHRLCSIATTRRTLVDSTKSIGSACGSLCRSSPNSPAEAARPALSSRSTSRRGTRLVSS